MTDKTSAQSKKTPMSPWRAYLLEFAMFVVLVPLLLVTISLLADNFLGLKEWISFGRIGRLIGIVVAIMGLILWAGSPTLLIVEGKGEPLEGYAGPLTEGTQKLVRRGPYKYVRNPMYIGYLTLLAAIALLIDSPFLLFVGMPSWALWSNYYVTHYEEKSLEERFGDSYRQYKEEVPRWIPRFPQSSK